MKIIGHSVKHAVSKTITVVPLTKADKHKSHQMFRLYENSCLSKNPCQIPYHHSWYRGSPTYMVFTNLDPIKGL